MCRRDAGSVDGMCANATGLNIDTGQCDYSIITKLPSINQEDGCSLVA